MLVTDTATGGKAGRLHGLRSPKDSNIALRMPRTLEECEASTYRSCAPRIMSAIPFISRKLFSSLMHSALTLVTPAISAKVR